MNGKRIVLVEACINDEFRARQNNRQSEQAVQAAADNENQL